MFGNLLSYSGIVTKSKALGAKLLKPEQYETLANLISVPEFVNYLKSQPGYQELLTGYDERSLHRNKLEQIINNSLYLDYAKLFRFANRDQREGLDIIFFRYEINALKSCLRSLYTSNITLDFSLFESFFKKHSKLDIITLAESHTLEEFIGYLKDTDYHSLFQRVHQTTAGTLADFEVQLDIYYFNTVWKLRKHVSNRAEQKAFTDIIGRQIDLLNLLWIYRSKKYYDVDSAQIYSSIIPVHYKLTSDQLINIIECGSLDEFTNLVQNTCYRQENLDVNSSSFSIEGLYRQVITKLYRSGMRKYPWSMCSLYQYLHMKELEIDQITTILECVRYGLDPSDALNYIFT